MGVQTAPERLQQMLSGAPATADEVTDIHFALIAMQFNRDARAAKYRRFRRRSARSLIFAGLVLVLLNFLLCVAYAMLNMVQQAAPM